MFLKCSFFLKFSMLFMLVMASSYSSQNQPVIYEFAEDQEFYRGGKPQLYKEIHQVLKDEKFHKCEAEYETYVASILIKDDSKISFVKDFDTVAVQKNKCAYDLFRSVLPHLKNWKPLSVEGTPTNAIARVAFYPNALFENYKEGSVVLEPTLPEFPGGIHAFRQQFAANFNSNAIGHGKRMISIEITFVVNKEGVIEDVKMSGDGDKEVIREAGRAMTSIKARWKPSTVNGNPVKHHFRLPIKMQFEGESRNSQKEPPFDNMFRPGF